MRTLALGLVFWGITIPLSFSSNPVIIKAHKASHKNTMYDIEGGTVGSCSATAIAPHALLTASHCSTISAVIKIDTKDADLLGTMGDGLDHTIILLGDIEFKDTV